MIDKLLNLLEFRNTVSSITDAIACDDEIVKKIQLLSGVQDQFRNVNQSLEIDSALVKLNNIKNQNKDVCSQLDNLLTLIDSELDLLGSEIMANDPTLHYAYEFFHRQTELHDSADIIKTRIGKYTSWQYPGICIHPKNKLHIDWLVATDPLYILHSDFVILKNLVSHYHKDYQRRLRLYYFNENDFFSLPEHFAGLVMCWDSFNFLNMQLIEDLLQKSYHWLRPGGTLVANYNNCDIVETAQSLRYGNFTYCNPRALKKLADKVGFEVEFFDVVNETAPLSYTSWAEFHKPGTLSSIRAHQPLAEIIKII